MSSPTDFPQFTLSTRPDARSVPGLVIRRVDSDASWLERSNGAEWRPIVEADVTSDDEFVSLMVANDPINVETGVLMVNLDGGHADTVYGGTYPISGGAA